MTAATDRTLDLTADLAVAVGNADIARVRAHGADLVVDVRRAGTRELTSALGGPRRGLGHLARVATLLHRAGLRLDLRVDGRTVATAGRDTRSAWHLPWREPRRYVLRPFALLRSGALSAARGTASGGV